MSTSPLRRLMCGAAAGAAGTTALNAATYLDMAVRGRPASTTPERSVEKLSEIAHVDVPGDPDTRRNRVEGLGPLLGAATGTAVGAVYGLLSFGDAPRPLSRGGLLAGALAMVAANGPLAALELSDPRSWTASEWLSDVLPHAAYGLVTALTFAATDR
jgi:hypothetical protein